MLSLMGCQREDISIPGHGGQLEISFKALNPTEGMMESTIQTVQGYRFEDGILQEILPDISIDSEGDGVIESQTREGVIYFTANTDGGKDLTIGTTDLNSFLKKVEPGSNWQSDNLPMTGMLSLNGIEHSATVNLKRAIARLDVETRIAGVEVHDVTVKNVADRGFLWEQEHIMSPAETKLDEFGKQFPQPLRNTKQTLLYLNEQKNSELMVVANVAFGGGMHKLTSRLPEEIKRNTIYTLKINGAGGSLQLSVSEGVWEEGNQSEAILNKKGLIDVASTVLPAGIRVNEGQDSVFISYRKNTLDLVLLAESDSEIQVEGSATLVNVNVKDKASRGLEQVATVSVTTGEKMPGMLSSNEYILLKVFREGVLKGNVVLVFEPHPVALEGKIQFDENGVCDFARYVDGEIGTLTLPEGMQVELSFPTGQPRWMQLASNEETPDRYRVLGGWKPNDPEADGRTQEATLTFTDSNGSTSYTIKRKNYGLPVVNINGVWWCKYNLRGDAKKFEDQVSIKEDAEIIREDVKAYLDGCSDEEFYRLLGDQYQSGNTQGLKLVYQDNQFSYEGFTNNVPDLSSLDAGTMVPEGYRLPTYDDYRFFTWGNDCNLKYGNESFDNKLGQYLGINSVERNITIDNQNYGSITYYHFTYNGASLVLCGLGHQHKNGFEKKTILFATYGRNGMSWALEGYTKADGRGNWFKYANYGPTNTRTLRCIKKDVEYIYE